MFGCMALLNYERPCLIFITHRPIPVGFNNRPTYVQDGDIKPEVPSFTEKKEQITGKQVFYLIQRKPIAKDLTLKNSNEKMHQRLLAFRHTDCNPRITYT